MTYQLNGYFYRECKTTEKVPKGQVYCECWYDFGQGPVYMGKGPVHLETLKEKGKVASVVLPAVDPKWLPSYRSTQLRPL